MTDKNRKKLYLVDGTALAYRSHFAFIKNPLINSRGMNTGAIYGFLNILLKITKDIKPDYLAVVFDSKEPTFRHKKYKEYKATREKMPDEMVDQLPYIEKTVKALSIPYMAIPTFEADDILGTLATRFASKDLDIFLVTGDKDLMQFVCKNIYLYTPKKGGEVEIIDDKAVLKKFGVPPSGMTDLLSLMGDASDNIPGVPGIGEKTALKLIQKFGSLDAVLAGADRVESRKISESLKANRDLAILSRELVTIDRTVPIKAELDDLKIGEPDRNALIELFKELELLSFIEKLNLGVQEDNFKKSYYTVDTKERLHELLGKIDRNKHFVFDTETTSLSPVDSKIVGISFSFEEGEAYYLPFNLQNGDNIFDPEHLLHEFKPLFENPQIRKGGHNIKYDILVLRNSGIEVSGVDFDTMLESYLLDPGARQHNLDLVAMKNLKYQKIAIENLIGKGSDEIGMRDVEILKVAEYSCEDADITMRLHTLFSPQIEKFNLGKLYREVEIPLIAVLASMEWDGVSVDTEIFKKIGTGVDKNLADFEAQIYGIAGENFNINSHKQLGKILFEKLKVNEELGIKRVKKTKTGYSTDSAVLETLADHPIINKILEYRNLSKLKSTYLDALPALVNKKTGRIHTSFNQTVTATGRLSSSDPNMQNIPIRTEAGKEIRRAFVPKDKNWSLISADYSQIELRILAELSGDKNLIQTFKDEVDVHRRTAARIFGVPDKDVSDDLRGKAKAINFGIIYGMGPQRLARDTKISLKEAQDFIDSYFNNYPDIKQFIESQIRFAAENGFVTTLLGRRRYIPDILSDNPRLRINSEHIAVNTPIQGSAADMIKLAMIKIFGRINSEKLKSKMILQVHDELVFEAPDDEVEPLKKIVKKEMESAMELHVPIKVEIKSGKSWFEAH